MSARRQAIISWAVILGTMVLAVGLVLAPRAWQATAGGPVHDVTMKGMHFSPEVVAVRPGEHVRIRLHNEGRVAHDLTVNGVRSPRVAPGDTAILDVGELEESTTGWCTVAGHRQAGMVLYIVVVDAP